VKLRDAEKLLKKAGYVKVRANKHTLYHNPNTGLSFPLPRSSKKEIGPIIVRNLKRQIGV